MINIFMANFIKKRDRKMINFTNHVKHKMSQRGIRKNLLDIALIYGVLKADKVILNKKRCDTFLKKIDNYRRKTRQKGNQIHHQSLEETHSILLKIRDKGGITLVIVGETLITTYNTNIKLKRKRRYKGRKS